MAGPGVCRRLAGLTRSVSLVTTEVYENWRFRALDPRVASSGGVWEARTVVAVAAAPAGREVRDEAPVLRRRRGDRHHGGRPRSGGGRQASPNAGPAAAGGGRRTGQ